VARKFLDDGVLVNERNWDGTTAPHVAYGACGHGRSSWREGNVEIVSMLLDRGADVDLPYRKTMDYGGTTAIQIAAWVGNVDIVRLLIDRRAPIDSFDTWFCDDKSPLHYAIGRGHEDVLRLLLDDGANIHVASECCQSTALHHAAAGGWPGATQLLLDHGATQCLELEDRGSATAL
jgi:ankyrin repeat protein